MASNLVATGSVVYNSLVIAQGTTVSPTLPTGGLSLCGILIPSGFTGTTISFQASATATGTYVPVKTGTSNTVLSYTVAASEYISINPQDFYGIQFLQLVVSSQAGATTLVCSMKGI